MSSGPPEAPLCQTLTIRRLSGARLQTCRDELAWEEPLEIQVEHGPPEKREIKTVSITMRTPGQDRELAIGFLAGEGVLRSPDDVAEVANRGAGYGPAGFQNSVLVSLRPGVELDVKGLERNCYTTSSCGVCGKSSLEALKLSFCPLPSNSWQADEVVIRALPGRLREAQEAFRKTGGLHGAGLFTPEGERIAVREDVGRHNAVDKVIGSQFLAGNWPLGRTVLMVSGRASFELMQKALAAGIPMLVAVGAPSSLAAQVAVEAGATLLGFTKADGFNIYSGAGRVRFPAGTSYESTLPPAA